MPPQKRCGRMFGGCGGVGRADGWPDLARWSAMYPQDGEQGRDNACNGTDRRPSHAPVRHPSSNRVIPQATLNMAQPDCRRNQEEVTSELPKSGSTYSDQQSHCVTC
jgi:hypothetical protein